MKTIIVAIRYSVLLNDNTTRLSLQNKRAYQAALFSNERLRRRASLFEAITAPSLSTLIVPEDVQLISLIFTSSALPERARQRLESMAREVPSAEVIPVDPDGNSFGKLLNLEVDKRVDTGSCFATVRMDDDDALTPKYLQRLAPYVRSDLAGYAVSFPKGWLGLLDSDAHLEAARKLYYPKVALGMAYINRKRSKTSYFAKPIHVYSLGDHTKIDEKVPLILDASFRAYMRSAHDMNDSVWKADSMTAQRLPPESVSAVSNAFQGALGFRRPTASDSTKASGGSPHLASHEPTRTRAMRPWRLIGNPGNGGSWLAKVLRAASLDIGHERVRKGGCVSWMLATNSPDLPYGDPDAAIAYRYEQVALFMRNPFLALPSMALENRSARSFTFRRNHIRSRYGIDVKKTARSEADLAALTLLRWHSLCEEQEPRWVIKVDDPDSVRAFLTHLKSPDALTRKALQTPPRNTAEKKWPGRDKPQLDRAFLASIQPQHLQELRSLAARYGYDEPKPVEEIALADQQPKGQLACGHV